jgi:hypothetical protein
MKDSELFKDILDKCENLENRFDSFFTKSLNDRNIPENMFYGTVFIIKELIFGVDENQPTRKVEINKNRNMIKQTFLNVSNFRDTINVYHDIISQLEEFLNYVYNKFADGYSSCETSGKSKLSKEEFDKLKTILWSYGWESTSIRSYCSDLKNLIDNSSCLANTRSDFFKIKPDSVKTCKKDTLKRYYFTDTYELKNNIKYFDMNNMIFGETNTIMRMYNKISDFLFKDFMFMYNVIKTNIQVLYSKTTK